MKWGEGGWIISESRDINLWERGQVWRPVPSGEERPGLLKAGVCPCDPCCHIADAAAGRWHDGLSPGAGAKLRLAKGQGSGVRLELREGQDLRSGLEGTGCLCWGGRERTVPESSSWAVLGSSPPGPGPGAPPCPPGYRSTLGHRPDPFTMRVVSGVYPQLRLLLLLLLAPHSHEGGLPPQRRFEYKLSFKGPRLALPGAGIPFWSQHGDAILGPEEVRLVPSMQNRSGAVWGTVPVLFSAWEVEVQMRVTGPGRQGAQGMAVWYTQGRGHVGSVLGGLASWDGIGILFDSSAKDSWSRPAIRVLASDGHTPDEQLGWSPSARRDGGSRELGSCHRDFRNRPHPLRVRITYWGQRLQVSVNNGLIPNGPEEVCVDVGPLFLAPGGFFGVSAATSTLADDHDVLSFLTFSLSELGPQPPHQPFLEMEQLRLARQLEGLWARLALRAKEDVMPKLSSETQSEALSQSPGERTFDLEATLGRHSRILQALQGLSEQLAPTERRWKKQLGSLGQARPVGGWDSAQASALLQGQQTLLRDLQGMRDAAAHMASRAQVFYLPVGTKHHFLELTQILSLLQKDLRGPAKSAAKEPRPPGRSPGASSCLRPGIFLFFLLIQAVGFFCYVHFSRQEVNRSLQDYLSTGSLPLSPAPCIPRALGALRRQPLSSNMHA
ncbi:protein ERGIC-53-like isoform X3 [Manis javanica]|uniref:protein ERGIC-53-like isoform X3 n=1 Tax=Manis javanica TaxID=9974 RepID=UPI003C6D3E0B